MQREQAGFESTGETEASVACAPAENPTIEQSGIPTDATDSTDLVDEDEDEDEFMTLEEVRDEAAQRIAAAFLAHEVVTDPWSNGSYVALTVMEDPQGFDPRLNPIIFINTEAVQMHWVLGGKVYTDEERFDPEVRKRRNRRFESLTGVLNAEAGVAPVAASVTDREDEIIISADARFPYDDFDDIGDAAYLFLRFVQPYVAAMHRILRNLTGH